MGKYDPEATRELLVRAAFEEIHLSGVRAASLGEILTRAGVTKGALYHHFRNKHELCEAVIEEVIRPHVLGTWLAPLSISGDPIGTLQQILAQEAAKATPDGVKLGCPLNNLAQEVSSVYEVMERYGSIDYARSCAKNLAGAALREFFVAYGDQPDSEDREFIRKIILYMIERDL